MKAGFETILDSSSGGDHGQFVDSWDDCYDCVDCDGDCDSN